MRSSHNNSFAAVAALALALTSLTSMSAVPLWGISSSVSSSISVVSGVWGVVAAPLIPKVHRELAVLPRSVCKQLIELGEKAGFTVQHESIDEDEQQAARDDPTNKTKYVPSQSLDVYSRGRNKGILNKDIWDLLEPYLADLVDLVEGARAEAIEGNEDIYRALSYDAEGGVIVANKKTENGSNHTDSDAHDIARLTDTSTGVSRARGIRPPKLDWIFFRKFSPEAERNSLALHVDSNMHTINIAINDVEQDYLGGGMFYIRPPECLKNCIDEEDGRPNLPKRLMRLQSYKYLDHVNEDSVASSHRTNRHNTSEIIFPHLNAGDLILYNYTVWHAVAPIQKGVRYSLVLFYDMDNPMLGDDAEDYDQDDDDDDDEREEDEEADYVDTRFDVVFHNKLSKTDIDLVWVMGADASDGLEYVLNHINNNISKKGENGNKYTMITVKKNISPYRAFTYKVDEGEVFLAVKAGTKKVISKIGIRRSESRYHAISSKNSIDSRAQISKDEGDGQRHRGGGQHRGAAPGSVDATALSDLSHDDLVHIATTFLPSFSNRELQQLIVQHLQGAPFDDQKITDDFVETKETEKVEAFTEEAFSKYESRTKFLDPEVKRDVGVLPLSVCKQLIELGEKSFAAGKSESYESIDDDEEDENTVPAQQIEVLDRKRNGTLIVGDPFIWQALEPWLPNLSQHVIKGRDRKVHAKYFPENPDRPPSLDWVFFRKYSPKEERNSLSLHTDVNMHTLNIALNDDYEGGGIFYVKPPANQIITEERPRIPREIRNYEWTDRVQKENSTSVVFPQLNTGDIMVYNYTVWHAVAPIEKGTRYSLILFYDMDNPAARDEDDDDDDDEEEEEEEVEEEEKKQDYLGEEDRGKDFDEGEASSSSKEVEFEVDFYNELPETKLDIMWIMDSTKVFDTSDSNEASKGNDWKNYSMTLFRNVPPFNASKKISVVEGELFRAVLTGTDEVVTDIKIKSDQFRYVISQKRRDSDEL